MAIRTLDLDQKYTAASGPVFLNGIQALVRLPMLQQQRDSAAGLNTAGLVTGYRGSPLGGVDMAMRSASAHLQQHRIVVQQGLNEDLAATAAWGSQQVNLFEGARYDGVFALWYGKGPGLDRSGDVLKHGNAAGSSRYGGVLLIAGDDHAAKSSTFPHQSDHLLIASMIPVLSPSGVQEVLDYGLHGWAMSRFSGCWVALKAISDTIESSAVVDIACDRVQVVLPDNGELPADGLNIRWPDPPLEQEKRLLHHRLYAALAYARANRLNRIVLDSPAARLGIITTGKSFLDVMQALDDLGIDEALASDIGLRIFKVGMVWPLEPEGVRDFATGLEEILVVEEKRQIIEYQLKEQLYNWREDVRPRVVGKFAEKGEWALPHGDWLLPSAGELTPAMIARAIASRLATVFDSRLMHDRLEFYRDKESQLTRPRQALARLPHYCPGCPHNRSTRLPEGSRALAGIGCHYMATWVDSQTRTFAQMGGEGVPWIGQAPFTSTPHVFANLGDGTYFHSGLLAIRAAVAARVNITYKILYNNAVAMTGGQAVDGDLDVALMTRQLHAENVGRIVITSDQPEKYRDTRLLAPGVEVHHRRELDRLQRELREEKGTTILIHDQGCAADLRRKRKRGEAPDPNRRAYINQRVCEGCGDCGDVSGCLALLPVETPLGRKRQIDQSSCNKDFSCTEGFCPSFVTVTNASLRRPDKAERPVPAVPPPPLPPTLAEPYGILVAGVGGTGVVTIGQVLGMATHLDGLNVTVLDMAGLAQKGGSVWSHIRLAPSGAPLHAVRIAAGDANLLIACDLAVGAAEETLAKLRVGFSHAVINSNEAPTSSLLRNPDLVFPGAGMKASIAEAVGTGRCAEVDANRLAVTLLGDAIASNMFMLGFAWQRGLLPLSENALLEAIRLNGAAVEFNRRAFLWGRVAGHDVLMAERLSGSVLHFVPRETPEALMQQRMQWLTRYQDTALAQRYRAVVERVRTAEKALQTGSTLLTRTVAKVYYQRLAYKDEYEVARLYSDGEFEREMAENFEGPVRMYIWLSPGWLSRFHRGKIRCGPWIRPFLKVLASLRFLRSTRFDPFAWQADRRLERKLILDFESQLECLLSGLNRDTLPLACEIVQLGASIRGFGHIKAAHSRRIEQQQRELLERYRTRNPGRSAA
ncbi:indolepyruvate ferredoxin oxidoreductase family protein [Paludibacterium yongneupense]|uniref:indolepyruvate ferredoxin oxidoreductase family protein n=1 Tax=Paludibacterium yongneupense TaxID=400061 RepID=UPI000402E6D7|nr:indolepyruvate ferredoxin oxidoreductase family protein [Paludibacterium yongneupense]